MGASDVIAQLPYEFFCPTQVQTEIESGAAKCYAVNFPAVIDALADIGFDQWAQLETSCPSKNVAADFKRNKQFVEDLIGKRNRNGSAAKE
jgi:hypothetical protein